MALQKQSVPINFSQGLDLKSDPYQIPFGKFLYLKNTVFEKGGRLKKRNGFGQLSSLPDTSTTFLSTFSGNLTAIGTTLQAYNAASETWVNKGNLEPCTLDVLPLVRSNTSQTQSDAAVSSNGLVCTVFVDTVSGSPVAKYEVSDSTTGQTLIAPTALANATTSATAGGPRVFTLGNFFVIVFSSTITATNHLQYLAININTLTVGTPTDLSTTYTPSSRVNFDAVVANNNLYVAWNGSDGGGAIRMTYLDSTLLQHGTVVFAGRVATIMSVSVDNTTSTPVIYAAFYDSASTNGYVLAVNQALSTVLAPTQIINGLANVLNITSAAENGVLTFFYEVQNAYSYDSAIKSNFIRKNTITQGGSVGSSSVLVRSVGLASKAFIINSIIYFLSAYSSSYQPTYFLLDSSGNIISRLAYSNGGGYLALGLPSVTVTGNVAQVAYLYRDLIQPINKSQGASNAGLGVYAQTGVNLVSFTIGTSDISAAEIGGALQMTGGFLWMYDGVKPVEQNFFLWPDNVEVTTSGAGGSITAQQYYYVAVYSWMDASGNIHRSAPSIPVAVTTTGATSSNTVNIPYLRLTYKTNVNLEIYRWSTAQQTYYMITSVTNPTVNSTTSDSVAYVDTQADSAIIGNNILYTTGGVVEDVGAPSFSAITLFKSRLFGIDSEDKNLLWFSKQVIENTPVEMSDLFTLYVGPTVGSQGSTGELTALSALDDKLILFKRDAIYFITGTGPDNTGANNDFSDPVFITSTVGCSNQNSVVFIPQGLMFQSDKGIWLLGRDLSTTYIGSPVEDFNSFTVLSALTIPGTNQVRFTLSNNVTLMYDYFYNQWGTFYGVPSVAATLYENLHTYVDQYGRVYQETPGAYLDGTTPVVMGFITGWFNLAGLQGFERIYWLNFLGTFISPHKLTVGIGYDYNSSATQSVTISPDNYNLPYGDDPLYGSTQFYGGVASLEQWRVFFERQKCQAFQLSVNEVFDSTYGTVAGEGLTMSGLNLVVGAKGTYPRLVASRSVG